MFKKSSIIALMLMTLSATAFSQSSFSEVSPNHQPTPVSRVQTPQTNLAGLTFYTDQSIFQAAAPGATLEDFASTLIAPNNICVGFAPLNSANPGVCFGATDLNPGFTLNMSTTNDDYAYLTTGFLGTPKDVIGPNTFTDDLYLYFTDATAVGFFLHGDLVGAVAVDIEIYSGMSLLGTSSAVGTANGLFWGVASDTPITEIRIIGQNGNDAELISDLQYGAFESVPTLGTSSLIGFMTLILVVGVFYIRKQRPA